MNYTKGQWKAEWDYLGGYDCMSHAYRIYSGDRLEGPLITVVDIADYKANQDGNTEEETNCLEAKANAYLIAAAPEMYEALKAMPKYASEIGEYALDLVLRAINKAEGKNDLVCR